MSSRVKQKAARVKVNDQIEKMAEVIMKLAKEIDIMKDNMQVLAKFSHTHEEAPIVAQLIPNETHEGINWEKKAF